MFSQPQVPKQHELVAEPQPQRVDWWCAGGRLSQSPALTWNFPWWAPEISRQVPRSFDSHFLRSKVRGSFLFGTFSHRFERDTHDKASCWDNDLQNMWVLPIVIFHLLYTSGCSTPCRTVGCDIFQTPGATVAWADHVSNHCWTDTFFRPLADLCWPSP